MRQPAYFSLVITSIIAAGITGGACSNEILFDPGETSSATATATGSSGGVGGAGGAPAVTATVTGPGSTGSTGTTGPGPVSASVSTTGGGNTLCDLACSHGASCGSDLCQQFGVNCTSVSTQFDCPLKCITAATCSDINKLAMQQFNTALGACVIGCQGSTGSGPPPPANGASVSSVASTAVGQTASSSVTSGGGQAQCQQCALQSCASTLQSCLTDNSPGGCAKWGQCIQGCQGSPSCYDDCDAKFPSAAAKYKTVYGCLCMSCGAACGATIDPCSHL
jgi:hypothetical protein